MSENVNLVKDEFWNETYGRLNLKIAEKNHVVREWFEKSVPKGEGSCIEIGCFPGQFLACFGELGYELNGLDLIPKVKTILPQWLKDCGYNVGTFYNEDFLTFKMREQFNIVASFGFVEHFTNWEEVINSHMKLVKENGYLIISAPNFRGLFQRAFQSLFNKESYKRHNIQAMKPEEWAKIIGESGFKIVSSGYFGHFHYWVNEQKRDILSKIVVHFFIDILLPIIKWLPFPKDKKLYSPFCGVIAKKI